jgi:hypothetical protein
MQRAFSVMRDPVEDLLGYKARAITAPKSLTLPVLDYSEPSSNVDELHAAAVHLVFPLLSRRWRVAAAAVCVALPIAASYGRPSKPQDLSDPELMSNAWDEPAILDAQPARNLRDVRSSTISHPPTTSRSRPRRHRR